MLIIFVGFANLTIPTTSQLPHNQIRRPTMRDYLLQSRFLMMPSTCSTDLLYWSYAEQLASQSVLRPASRDQIRWRAVRQRQSSTVGQMKAKAFKQQQCLRTSFLPTSGSSFVSGRLDLQRHHWNRLRTPWAKTQNTWKPPDQSSLHDICRTGIVTNDANFVFLQKTILVAHAPKALRSGAKRLATRLALRFVAVSLDTNRFGGAERDRTADPLLAKQVLSQLSYSPISSIARASPGSATFRVRKPNSKSVIPQPAFAKANGGPG
jgi:hypothetical protein